MAKSPFRLFIGVPSVQCARIRDIRYRSQWRISIFSLTCQRLLRGVPILYLSQILHLPFVIADEDDQDDEDRCITVNLEGDIETK